MRMIECLFSRRCGCDVISMRAKAQYVLKATSWISILLAFRYPFLGTIIYALLRRLFIAMPMFMMWFTVGASGVLLLPLRL